MTQAWFMDKMSEEAKIKIKNMGTGMNTPAPINYETALPQGVGKLVQQEDGSMILANEHDQGFILFVKQIFLLNQLLYVAHYMISRNQLLLDLPLQRNQVEKEVMQLLQQLRDGGLIAIAGQPDTPNVEFKK